MPDLQKLAFYGKIVYENVIFDTKMDKSHDLEEAKKKLRMLTEVTSVKECSIVWYSVEYAK